MFQDAQDEHCFELPAKIAEIADEFHIVFEAMEVPLEKRIRSLRKEARKLKATIKFMASRIHGAQALENMRSRYDAVVALGLKYT